MHVHVAANQRLSTEERQAFRILREEFGTVVDDTLREQIARRIRSGSIELRNADAIRRDLRTHIQDFTEEFQIAARVGAEDAARAGRATAQRRLGIQIDTERIPRQTLEELDDWTTTLSQEIPETLEDELTAYLRGAHEEGLSVDDVAEQFQEEFVDGRLADHKAEQWARDNTVAPSNAGSHSGYREADTVVAEEWVATGDGRTRDTHEEAHGQVVGVDTPFLVGGYEAQHPGDPRLPVEESTQCRCTLVPVLGSELTEGQRRTLEAGGRFWR